MAISWGFRKAADVPSPETGNVATPGSDPLDKALSQAGSGASAAAGIVEGRKRRKDAGQPRGSRGSAVSPEQAALSQAFAELYKPEVWEGVMCGPADTMLAISGRAIWNLSQKERNTLSITGAMTAKCFAVENPKWLALILLSISLIQIYGGRAAIHMAEKEAERKKAKADATKPAA